MPNQVKPGKKSQHAMLHTPKTICLNDSYFRHPPKKSSPVISPPPQHRLISGRIRRLRMIAIPQRRPGIGRPRQTRQPVAFDHITGPIRAGDIGRLLVAIRVPAIATLHFCTRVVMSVEWLSRGGGEREREREREIERSQTTYRF